MQQRILRILWPAFLVAGALEIMVFGVVDPRDMRWYGGPLIGWSPMAIHSITFLLFWFFIATSGALTLLLTLTADEINDAAPAQAAQGEPVRGP